LCVILKHQEWVLHIYIYIYDISRLRVKFVCSYSQFLMGHELDILICVFMLVGKLEAVETDDQFLLIRSIMCT